MKGRRRERERERERERKKDRERERKRETREWEESGKRVTRPGERKTLSRAFPLLAFSCDSLVGP